MIKRELEKKIKETAKNIPVIEVVGPRQKIVKSFREFFFNTKKYNRMEYYSVIVYILKNYRNKLCLVHILP